MKAVILAGGMGTRISEESHLRPKPMIEIGGRPILWHILKMYSSHGIHDFVICCGYKGYMIKEYFANYFLHTSDVTFDVQRNMMEVHQRFAEPWRVTLVDTGEHTMTGGRLRRVAQHLSIDSDFCFTYGDGVSDVDIGAVVRFHRAHGAAATLTAVAPAARFGVLDISKDGVVRSFAEKPEESGGLVNGGFFVLKPSVLELLQGDDDVWERAPLERLARTGQLRAYHHRGFWHPMDTLRDRQLLEELWRKDQAPWKTWT